MNALRKMAIANFLFSGLCAMALVIALILQLIPILAVVVMFSMAVGVTQQAALTVVPVAFMSMMFVCCMIASILASKPAAESGTGRRDPAVRPGSRMDSPAIPPRPGDHYRDLKRLSGL